MIDFLDRAVLVVTTFFTLLWIFYANPFWSEMFFLRNHLKVYGSFLVSNYFSLTACKIISLSFNFAILIMICLGVGLFDCILIGTLWASWTCVVYFFTKLSNFYFFKQVVDPLLTLFSSGTLVMQCCYACYCSRCPLDFIHF